MFQVEYVARNLRILACGLVAQDMLEEAVMLRVVAQQIVFPPVLVEQVREILLTVVAELNKATLPNLAATLQGQIGTLFNDGDEFTDWECILFPNNGGILNVCSD